MSWQILCGILVTPWLMAGAITSGIARRNGWEEWRWLLLSLATGPVSWLMLYLKIREERERVGPTKRRRGIPPPTDPLTTKGGPPTDAQEAKAR